MPVHPMPQPAGGFSILRACAPAALLVLSLALAPAPAAAAGRLEMGMGALLAEQSPRAQAHAGQHDGSVGRSRDAAAGAAVTAGKDARKKDTLTTGGAKTSSARAAAGKVASAGKGAAKDRKDRAAGSRDSAATPSEHAAAWSFGVSPAGGEPQGVDGSTLYEKALRGARAEARASSSGADAAAGAKDADGRHAGMAFSVDTENQGWSVRHNSLDENIPMESNHRVSAFAEVRDGDVSFGMGPQLIIRDTQQTHEYMGNNSEQPDVQAGVGMRMQLDF